jgi:hypothetical protein
MAAGLPDDRDWKSRSDDAKLESFAAVAIADTCAARRQGERQ